MPRPTKIRTSVEDDIDAITPCPLSQEEPTTTTSPPSSPQSSCCRSLEDDLPPCQPRSSTSSSSGCAVSTRSASPSSDCGRGEARRRDSVRALEEGTDGDPARLWKRMLALQQIYGCYNSARMSAALSSGDIGLLLRM